MQEFKIFETNDTLPARNVGTLIIDSDPLKLEIYTKVSSPSRSSSGMTMPTFVYQLRYNDPKDIDPFILIDAGRYHYSLKTNNFQAMEYIIKHLLKNNICFVTRVDYESISRKNFDNSDFLENYEIQNLHNRANAKIKAIFQPVDEQPKSKLKRSLAK